MPRKCLPDHLKDKTHEDWFIWPLTKVPRAWWAQCGKNWPMPPKRLLGWSWCVPSGQGPYTEAEWAEELYRYSVKPIPQPGNFILSAIMYRNIIPLLYFAKRYKNGHFFYIGTRWDDVDNYVELFLMRAHGLLGILSLLGILLGAGGIVWWIL